MPKNITKIRHIKSGIYKQKIESFPEVTASSLTYIEAGVKREVTLHQLYSVLISKHECMKFSFCSIQLHYLFN